MLAAYPGTILFASHDRMLISRVAGQLLVFGNVQVRPFDGTYEDYRCKSEEAEEHVAADTVEKGQPSQPAEAGADPAVRETMRLQLELELAEVLGPALLAAQGRFGAGAGCAIHGAA